MCPRTHFSLLLLPLPLFGSTPDDVQRELGRLATEKQFGSFARDFFSRFTERFLTYHVDRELPRQVGPEGRFPSNGQRHEFSRAFELHCQQASKIVESFAGAWYSKARFEKELFREDAAASKFCQLVVGQRTRIGFYYHDASIPEYAEMSRLLCDG